MADETSTEVEPFVPLVPDLVPGRARETSYVAVHRILPSDGFLDRVEPDTTVTDIQERFGGKKFRMVAHSEQHRFLGSNTLTISGEPKGRGKKSVNSEEETPTNGAGGNWGPLFDPRAVFGGGGEETSSNDRLMTFLEQKNANEAEAHRRRIEEQEARASRDKEQAAEERRAEKSRADDEHKRKMEELKAEKELAEKKIQTELEKFKLQMDADSKRRDEERKDERERAEREDKRRREENEIRLKEMREQQKADVERLDRAQAAERSNQREFHAAMAKQSADFTAAMMAANKKEDTTDRMLQAIKLGMEMVPKGEGGGGDFLTPLASTLALVASEAVKSNREKTYKRVEGAMKPKPPTRPAAASPTTPQPKPAAPSAGAKPAAEAPQGVKLVPGPLAKYIGQLDWLTADSLAAVVMGAYEKDKLPDNYFDFIVKKPENEVWLAVVQAFGVKEIFAHRELILEATRIVKQSVRESENESAAPDASASGEMDPEFAAELEREKARMAAAQAVTAESTAQVPETAPA